MRTINQNSNELSVPSLIHKGFIRASALLFDFDIVCQREAQIRILELWQPGCKIFALENGLVLQFTAQQPVYAESCQGLPLASPLAVNYGPLVALPLTEKQLSALPEISSVGRTVIRLKHGKLHVEQLSKEIDPAYWLDLSNFEIANVVIAQRSQQDSFKPTMKAVENDARKVFDEVPPPAEELKEFMKNLQEAGNRPTPPASNAASDSVQSGLNAAFSWMNKLLGGTAKSSANAQESDLVRDLKNATYKFLAETGLLQVIADKQGQYLHKMINMFERGDWEQALRFGIPLGRDAGPSSPWLGVPAPRDSLDLKFSSHSPGASLLGSGPELFEKLRVLYRQAFERLAASGEIDQAAFILSELLQDDEEAVSFLERHGKLHKAAQLAEARRLRPEIVVRLWYLAGNVSRAISVARMTNTFAEAVRLLEQKDKSAAQVLRGHWAIHLTASGNYAAAAMAAMPLPEMREAAITWTKLALQVGHSSSGQLLANWMRYLEDSEWLVFKGHITELLEDESRENAPARMAFVQEFGKAGLASPPARVIARAATRAALHDYGNGFTTIDRKALRAISAGAEDKALSVDLNSCSLHTNTTDLLLQKEKLLIEVGLDDRGVEHIHDAAFLPNGKTLVALGEGGLCLLNRDGKVSKHFNAPAYELVMSRTGGRVLAIAPRNDARRITKINCGDWSTTDWGELPLDAYAPSFDGSMWFAGHEKAMYVVDTTAPKFRILWQMPNVEENVISINSDPYGCAFICSTVRKRGPLELSPSEKTEMWRCDLPGVILRERRVIASTYATKPHSVIWYRFVSPQGNVITVGLSDEAVHENRSTNNISVHVNNSLVQEFWTNSIGFQPNNLRPNISVSVSNKWIALCFPDAVAGNWDGRVVSNCYLINQQSRRTVAHIRMEGTMKLKPGLDDQHLTLCDERGRILVMDLRTGAIVSNLRL